MSDAQQAALEMQTVQQRLQQLDRNLAQLEANLQELHAAVSTLEGLGAGGQSTLVPVGAGVRIAAQVDGDADVLVDLGAKHSAKLSKADAIERLRDRIRNTEAAFRATSDEADKAAQRFQDLQMQTLASSDSS